MLECVVFHKQTISEPRTFGKVYIVKKKRGNIYQKWRHIACYTKLNIVLGDRTQIIKIGLDSTINYFIYTII